MNTLYLIMLRIGGIKSVKSSQRGPLFLLSIKAYISRHGKEYWPLCIYVPSHGFQLCHSKKSCEHLVGLTSRHMPVNFNLLKESARPEDN